MSAEELLQPSQPSRKSYGSSTSSTKDSARNLSTYYRTIYLTVISAIGGFLFGYDTGVISGAMLLIKDDADFNGANTLTTTQQELVVTSTVVFAAVFSLAGGTMSDVYGRKPMLLLSSSIFTVGAVLLAVSPNVTCLVASRCVVGMGIGFASLTTPMYIAEIATSKSRGPLVTVNVLCIASGQFIAGMVDGALSNTKDGWRFMLGLAAVPSAIMFLGFLPLPESPRWLVQNGRKHDALAILKRFRETDAEAVEEVEQIVDSIIAAEALQSVTKQTALQHAPTRRALVLGCGLMVLQQFAGINTVMYYAASIYEMSGYSQSKAIWLSGFTALAQVFGIAISIVTCEKFGRRSLVLFSLTGVAVSLLGLGVSFYLARISSGDVSGFVDPDCSSTSALVWSGVTSYCYDCVRASKCGYCDNKCVSGDSDGPFNSTIPDTCGSSEWVTENCDNPYVALPLVAMISYLFFFGIGMGGMPWTINSEIYPLQYRGVCLGYSTAANWIGNIVISATFLSISDPGVLTAYGAFWLYACISVMGLAWLYSTLPETKGLTLEEVEKLFVREGDEVGDVFDLLDEEVKRKVLKTAAGGVHGGGTV
jgi:SP family myo-inositol transporter-like MFS transporter 13